jgi:hypothetical protein
VRFLLLLFLGGCVTSYKHISDPNVNSDGVDLVCGGFEQDIENFTGTIEACTGVGNTSDERIAVEVKYHWGRHGID